MWVLTNLLTRLSGKESLRALASDFRAVGEFLDREFLDFSKDILSYVLDLQKSNFLETQFSRNLIFGVPWCKRPIPSDPLIHEKNKREANFLFCNFRPDQTPTFHPLASKIQNCTTNYPTTSINSSINQPRSRIFNHQTGCQRNDKLACKIS